MPSPSAKVDSEQVVDELITKLLQEPEAPKDVQIPADHFSKRQLLRGLLNIRQPKLLDEEFLRKLDSLLQTELKEKGVVKVDELNTVSHLVPNNPFSQSDKFVLWQGDITQLDAGAIVNAANKYMLGCFQPSHACIDNAIHSAAGPQLRNDCEIIMSQQGELEHTGGAKITRAYNLPSQYVLHTVGPIVPNGTTLTKQQKEELAACYISCLELAREIKNIETIAFCAISTGVFGFPKREAANIAIDTVNDWLATQPNHFKKIIFNVFGEEDYHEYLKVFQQSANS
ncbi:Appr-1-p processing protein [Bacillus solimangrovi]|uniref:Protein-ADP-ribose hydrolase n=1 Tax=Bacillus solimangrovi TaxID=1305675 RepID=A0A1E5LEV6_9BACI|nr:Appr-1-p processing protein [Bacillus solimangrovi]